MATPAKKKKETVQGLAADVPMLVQYWKDNKGWFKHNQTLFDIFEGDLISYLIEEFKQDFSPQTFKEVLTRIAPVNILERLIGKLSKIYQPTPVRTVGIDGDEDKAASEDFQKITDTLDTNVFWGSVNGANGLFNLYKCVWLKPYIDPKTGKPAARALNPSQFFVISKNKANPLVPTHFVEIMGKIPSLTGRGEVTLFHAYTEDEIIYFDSDKIVRRELMTADRVDGSNPIEALPGVYINRSKALLQPKPDFGMLKMTTLLPILLSDLNYALKYTTFGMIYTIDIDQAKLVAAPNSLLDLKTNKSAQKAGSIGTIKPDVDSDKALTQIKAQLAIWMESKNIKPGAMGDVTVENGASGIAKAIDEMDTWEDRANQVPYFVAAEADWWKLILTKYHPYWVENFGNYVLADISFDEETTVTTKFSEQKPYLDPGASIDNQVKKLDARIQTRRGALQELYPDWTEAQLDEKMAELDDEDAEIEEKELAKAEAEAKLNPQPAPFGGKGKFPPKGGKPVPPKKGGNAKPAVAKKPSKKAAA